MFNEEQGSLFESNSPSEPGDSSRTTGPINVEHAHQANGTKQPLTAAGSVDSEQLPKMDTTGPIKVAGSADGVQTSQTDSAPGPGKISVDDGQAPTLDGASDPGKAGMSADGNQPPKENVSTHKSADDKQSPQDNVPGPGQKFAFDMKDVMTQIVGDNAYVNLSVYVNMAQRKSSQPFDSFSEDGTQNEESASSNELISKALKFAEQNTTFFSGSESKSGSIDLPETEEQFSQWYYGLGDYEQCYVQTVAVLHGAPAHEISKNADILYQSFCDEVVKRESSVHFVSQLGLVSHQGNQQKTQLRGSSRFPNLLLRRIPGRELHLSTYTKTGWEEDVEGLYWRDVDQFGLSAFGINLLSFLTNEIIIRGEYGQKFLDFLYDWSKDNSKVKLSWKVAHSYGVVLWCHDAKLLAKRAEEWAKVRSRLSWRRTAELLDGAFEIERIKIGEKANVVKPSSVVLRLLDNWIDRVHQEFNIHIKFRMEQNNNLSKEAEVKKDKANLALATNLAWAVANTYELIGKRSPEIALAGLQRLLQLPLIESDYYTRSIYAAGVSTYVNLARSRRVRNILQYLDDSAECLSHQRLMPGKMEERLKYRLYRQIYLNAIFDTFFTIAVESYLGRREKPPASYSLTEPLPPQPAIPDPEGRDVLLAGLLSQNENEAKLKEHMTALLCTAIIEKKSRLAFSLLRFWADIVFDMLRTPEIDRDAVKKFVAFYWFIVNLGKTVDSWCLDLEKQGFCSPQAVDAYKCRLEQWYEEGRTHSHPIGSLAEEVLKKLDGKFQL